LIPQFRRAPATCQRSAIIYDVTTLLGNVFAQMLQVRAAHACAALLCGRHNTCNGEKFISRKDAKKK